MSRPRRAALAGAAAVAALLLAGCSNLSYQSTANDQAASIADRNLPGKIDAKLADLETKNGSARAARVRSWLDDPDPDGIDPPPRTWVTAGPRAGTTIPVVVHYRMDETMLSDAAWGLACRDYVIGDRVEVLDKPCPEGTPETAVPPEVLGD